MELVFVRHGEPAWNRDGLSVDDPGLTARGHDQARLLAERLDGEQFDRLYVSTLRRAQETAAPVAEAIGHDAAVTPWLREIRMPELDGTPTETVEKLFNEHRGKPVAQHWEGLEGGESFRDFHLRVTDGLDAMLAEAGITQVADEPRLWSIAEPDRRILLVAHGGTNAVSLAHLLGIPPTPWEWERFVSFHASVSIIRPMQIADAWSFSLFRFADVAHLPDELQTR